MADFEKCVGRFARMGGLFAGCGPVAAAVSGGADSTALLLALKAAGDMGLFDGPLLCIHLHHQLRGGEADADMQFTIELARSLGVEVITERIDVRGRACSEGVSIETAGRNLRIERLTEIAASRGCTTIATGHHRDDNAETLIQRLARGTGYRGLCGIRPVATIGSARFIRPLLCVRRRRIEQYLREKNLPWRTDRTNVDCGFRRNYIRHRLLPEIAAGCEDDIVEQLWRLSESARRFREMVEEQADRLWDSVVTPEDGRVIVDAMDAAIARPVQLEILRRSLTALGIGERDLGFNHYRRLLELAEDPGSGAFELPGRIRAVGVDGRLLLCRTAETPSPPPEPVEVAADAVTQFGDSVIETRTFEAGGADIDSFRKGKDNRIEWMDADRVAGAIIARPRAVGDRFIPLGMSAAKKLGKFMTAEKVDAKLRGETFVLADPRKIIWLCPVRLSEQVKVTAQTRRILEIRVSTAD